MAERLKYRKTVFPKGALLTEEGKLGEFVYLIRSGKVEVRIGSRTDAPRVLGVRGTGELIGELSVFDGMPQIATVSALEETEAIAMSRDEFLGRVKTLDPIMRATVTLLIARLRHLVELLRQKSDPVNWWDWKRKK